VEAGGSASTASVEPPGWARGLERFIDRLGRAVAWLGLGMVVTTFGVVVLRYAFSVGSVALQEAVAYMHAALFMLGASYALLHDGHVRVDVLYRGWSLRARAWVDLAGTVLLLLPFCAFTLGVSFDYVASSWALLEGSAEAGGLPGVFLLKSLIPVMAALLVLAGAARAARCVVILRGARR
jgi:TRAP-type mannitol/chloroaromatic compound transport system permease small subunit